VNIGETLGVGQGQPLEALLGLVLRRVLRTRGIQRRFDATKQHPGRGPVAAQATLVLHHPQLALETALIDARERIGQPLRLALQGCLGDQRRSQHEIQGLSGLGDGLPFGAGSGDLGVPGSAVGRLPAVGQVLHQVCQPLLPRWVLGLAGPHDRHDRHRWNRAIHLRGDGQTIATGLDGPWKLQRRDGGSAATGDHQCQCQQLAPRFSSRGRAAHGDPSCHELTSW
jgi:hypothetical protein